MKKIYTTLLLAALISATAFSAPEVNPDDLNLPEEKWDMHYDRYQSLFDNNPIYRNQSHQVTLKKDADNVYIRGIFTEYPDIWVVGTCTDTFIVLINNQELSSAADTPGYFQFGDVRLVSRSGNEREYTVGVSMTPTPYPRWVYTDDGENQVQLVPQDKNRSLWIGPKPRESWSILRTYYYDAPATGDTFDPQPIYLNPTFHKVSSSGIQDNVIDEQRPEDNRVFDLSGRQVNPDRLTPGMYIRAGRKFIVR